jgi:hypothetical protein
MLFSALKRNLDVLMESVFHYKTDVMVLQTVKITLMRKTVQ